MNIELWNGDTKATIDLHGAWLTNLSDERGDILFPRRVLQMNNGSTKQRGGLHVCLPNFGPGGESGQPQHGFGRDINWNISEQTEARIALLLEAGRDGYEGLGSMVVYELGQSSLLVTLDLINNSTSSLRIAPAFHPYFNISSTELFVMIDRIKQPLEDIGEAQFTTSDIVELQTANRRFTLASQQLTTWVRWTDRLGAYVCVEPSFGGFTFLNNIPLEGEIIAAGATRTYGFSFQWS